MDDDERLRLEYDQAVGLLRSLADTRLKLVALLPTLSGAAVALLRPGAGAVLLVAVGLLGLTATAGVVLYELRNGEIERALAARVGGLEARLFAERGPLVAPARERLFGLVRLSHGAGVALVYGAAAAGWIYLLAWGVLRELGLDRARPVGVAAGAAAGLLLALEIVRLETAVRGAEAAAGPARSAAR